MAEQSWRASLIASVIAKLKGVLGEKVWRPVRQVLLCAGRGGAGIFSPHGVPVRTIPDGVPCTTIR
ncbi:hypothetical protein [Streptomyces sp. NPDC001903]|uniref:hypothetical protein n=1 Tax=Streptomyces sp. NPDC001903 TaxID=3364622 RepID=UPI0036C3F9C8